MNWKRCFLADPRPGMASRPWWWRALKWLHLSRGWMIQRLPDLVRRIDGYGAVDTLVDVGVCWGTPALWSTNPRAELVLVDPGRCDLPEHRGACTIRAAAGDHDGTAWFNRITTGNEGQSKIGQDGSLVPMLRIDSLGLYGRIGLKIDVEGNEMAVLRGCEGVMKRVQWAIVEWHLHGGDCLPSEMVEWFADRGMELHDTLHGINPDAPHVTAMDVVFRRPNATHEPAREEGLTT